MLTTQRPTPLDAPERCDCDRMPRMAGEDTCGQCAFDAVNGLPTTPAPPPPRVPAYLAKRSAIAALWREADALWDDMTESERDHAVSAVIDRARRGR